MEFSNPSWHTLCNRSSHTNMASTNSTDSLTPIEILSYAKELGRSWRIFGIEIGFLLEQLEQLERAYPCCIQTVMYAMIQKWHDIILTSDDVGPKLLLAAAFSRMRDNLTAYRLLGCRELVRTVKDIRPKSTTLDKIRNIIF